MEAGRGGAAVKKRAGSILYGFLGGGGETAPAAPDSRTAQREVGQNAGAEQGAEGDAFEQYYKKHYSKDYGNGDSPDSASGPAPASWADVEGGGSSTGGGEGPGNGAAPQGRSGKNAKKGEEAAAASPGAEPASGPHPGFGGPASGGGVPAAHRMYASLPAKNAQANSGQNYGAQPGYGGGAFASGDKNGKLSGMPGGGDGGALNGASEKMKTGGQSDFNAKAGGGASAAAAGAGGKAALAASGPQQASTDGKGADKAGDKTADKAAKTDAGSGAAASDDSPAGVSSYDPSSGAQNVLKAVESEKLNGKDVNFVSADDSAAVPEESLLKAGASSGDNAEKDLSAADTSPDPETFSSLSEARKTELKKEVHTFLAKVENKYGKMQPSGILYTSCKSGPEVCSAHALTEGYLTMTTVKGATLVTALKYVKGKWRMYTVDFKSPASGSVKPPAVNTGGEVANDEEP